MFRGVHVRNGHQTNVHTYIHAYIHTYIHTNLYSAKNRENESEPACWSSYYSAKSSYIESRAHYAPEPARGQPMCCNGSRSLSLSRAWYVTTEHSGQSGRSAGRTLPDAALGDANWSGNDRVRPHRSPRYGRFQSAEPAIRRLDGQLMRRSFDSITRVWTVRSRTWIN